MAKIEFHRDKIELPESKKINSIVGQNYLDDYQSRKQEAMKRMQENGKTAIEAKDILVGKSVLDD